jgi:hypothetical protein
LNFFRPFCLVLENWIWMMIVCVVGSKTLK